MHKKIIYVLAIFLVSSIILNVFLYSKISSLDKEFDAFKDTSAVDETKFPLLSPDIAVLEVDEFLEKQKSLNIVYAPMRQSLDAYLALHDGHYGVYFEDLNTGAWVGINERERFYAQSLLKIPVAAATLKSIQEEEYSLDDTVFINASDLNNKSGSLWKRGENYEISIHELLVYLIKESDNTASRTLIGRVAGPTRYKEASLALGLPAPELDYKATPKEMANTLRGLYFSTYLRRPLSNYLLSLMLETDFNSQIPAGVPSDIKVSHKVGFYPEGMLYNDCGIIYVPDKPYILCVMSSQTTQEKSDEVISGISRIVYNYVSSRTMNVTLY